MNNLKEKIITNLKELEKRICCVMNKIFDSLRFPGGTSTDGARSSIVILTLYENKEFYFLVLPYRRLNINKNKGDDTEDPKSTAHREFDEETGLEINVNDLYLLDSYPVADSVRENMIHTKYIYHIDGSKVAGHLKEIVFLEENQENDAVKYETGTPILIPSRCLFEKLCNKHYGMAYKAIDYLLEDKDGKALEDKDYASALFSLRNLLNFYRKN